MGIQGSLPKINNVELTHRFMNESEGWLLVLGGRGVLGGGRKRTTTEEKKTISYWQFVCLVRFRIIK